MNLVEQIEQAYLKKKIPDFKPGDTIRVFAKVKEGEKERLQPFEGVLLRSRGGGTKSTITVRKVSYGIGVERIFPLHSPIIDHIEIVQRGKSRQARLYYLRKLKGRKAKMEVEEFFGGTPGVEPVPQKEESPKI